MQINGWILLVGIFCSSVPQMISFLRHGVFGVSFSYVLLTAYAGVFLAVATYAGKTTAFACCQTEIWTRNQCLDSLLPVFQFSAAFFGQLVLALIYMVRQTDNKMVTRIAMVGLVFLTGILSMSGGLVHAYGSEKQLQLFAIVCAIGNVLLGTLLFAPQILMTYRLKTSGSLSIITLLIQTGGLIDFIIFTIIEDPHEPYVYGAQIVQFSFCAILLGMCLYYDYVQIWLRRRRGDFGLEEVFDDQNRDHELQATNLLDEDLFDDDF